MFLKLLKAKTLKTVIPTKQTEIEPYNTTKLSDFLDLNLCLRQD